ncbi:MAG: PAS domain S-box protein [Deltaproteobacteria bacterium]|nr:MAG: PAS domain S-box protein [Deltaproteobacteria bacterium]
MNKPNESSSVHPTASQGSTYTASMGLLQHATDAYLLVRGEVVIAYNKAAAELLGNPTMQCSGNSIVECFSCPIRSLPDCDKLSEITKESLRSSLQELQETGKLHTQWTCYKYRGSALNVEVFGEQHQNPNEYLLLLKPLALPTATPQTQLRIFNNAERIASMGSWDWDLRTGELHWSDGLYRIYGRDPSQGPPTAKENYQILHPEDVETVEAQINKAINEQILEDSEYRILHWDKQEVRTLYAKADLETDEEGNPIRLYGSVKDITEQRRTEQQLQKALEQRNLAINTAQVGIWRLDLKESHLEWNDRLFEMYQVPREEFSHDLAHWRKRVHPDDLDGVLEQLAQVMEGQAVYNIEFRIIWPNGEIRHILASGSPIFDKDQNFNMITGVDLDITELRRKELQLRDALEQLNLSINTAKIGLWRVDLTTERLHWNENMFQLYDMTEEEFDHTVNSWTKRVHPDDLDEANEKLQAVLFGTSRVFDVNFRLIWPSGEIRHIMASASPNYNTKGEITGIIGINLDVTHIHRSEQARQENDALLQAIAKVSLNAITVFNNEGNFIFANQATTEMLGLPMDTLMGMSIMELQRIGVNDVEEGYKEYQKKGYDKGEVSFQHTDGSTRHAQYHIIPINESNHLSVLTDITEAKHTEIALRQSEEKYRSLFHGANDVILTISNETSNILESNHAAEQLLGYTSDEMQNISGMDLLLPEHRNTLRLKWRESLEQQGSFFAETQWLKKDGSIIDVAISGSQLKLGEQHVFQLIGRDITEAKRIETAMRRSEEKYRSLFQLAHDSILVVDAETDQILETNRAVEELLGYSRDELHTLKGAQVLAPEAIESTFQQWQEQVAAGRTSFLFETLWITKDSTRIDVVVSGSQININDQDMFLLIGHNITDRKQTELALRQSEEKYRALYNNAHDAILTIKNSTSEILEGNYATEQLLGYPLEELRGTSSISLLLPEVRHTIRLEWRRQLEEEGSLSVETQWLRKDGTPVDVAVSGNQIELGGEKVFQLIARDITEHKQVVSALRQSEEKYRSLYHDAHDAILTVSNETLEVLEGNRAVVELLGYTFDELRSISALELLLPEDRYTVRLDWQEQLENEGLLSVETQWLRKDGIAVDIAMTGSRLILDGKSVFQIIGRDITERKQTETALRRSEGKYRSLFQGAHDAILTVEPSTGRILDSNRAFEQMLDYTKDELQHLTSPQLLPPDELERIVQEWQMQMDLAEGYFFLETQWMKKGGERVDVAISGSQINIDEEEIHQLIGRDISARKRIERQLRQHRDQLEDIVASRTRELDALYKIASVNNQYDETKDILQAILDQALDAMDCEAGAIHYLDRETSLFELQVHRNLPPVIVPIIETVPEDQALLLYNTEKDPQPTVLDQETIDEVSAIPLEALGISYYAGVPIRAAGRSLGSLCVLRKNPEALPFTRSELTLLTSIAEQTGAVWENARLRKRDQKAAVLEERQRLARNLHDSVTQLLYSMSLLAEAGHRTQDVGKAQHYLERLGSTARQALKEMRLLIYELRPLLLEKEGLTGALRYRLDSVESRSGVEYDLSVDEIIDLDQRVEEELYRIALETLNNMLKHAQATHVTVKLQRNNGHILLSIADNGVGFDPEEVVHGGGLGLISIQERAERIHASFTCTSSPNQGTTIEIKVPY